ncbi:MAG TPA: MoaD/ThiS family protein [Coriobacteriia bacterium]|nr:MoaD/ThiS family protein [Coriobacteriia bacterium]
MSSPIKVHILASLQRFREERGLPVALELEVPDGADGWWLAAELGLPYESIEGMFVNHVIYGLDQPVKPGDRVALVPYGTPGPHRVYLGLFEAGVATRENLAEHAKADGEDS